MVSSCLLFDFGFMSSGQTPENSDVITVRGEPYRYVKSFESGTNSPRLYGSNVTGKLVVQKTFNTQARNHIAAQQSFAMWEQVRATKNIVAHDPHEELKARQVMNFIRACGDHRPEKRPQSGKEMRQILTDKGNLTEI